MFSSQITLGQTGFFGSYFIDTATAANTQVLYPDQTTLNNTAINGDSNAIFLFTPNWTAGTNVYNNVATGVYYNTATAQWSIFNENGGSFPVGFAANVLIPSAHGNSFTSVATSPAANFTDIDDPSTNGNPGVMVFVTHNWGTGYGAGNRIYDTVPVGVWYNTTTSKWSIFNEKVENAMAADIAFNVFVADTTGGAAFIQVSSAANTLTDNTILDNPLTNNNPNAVVLVTQNYNGGPSHSRDSVPVGVFYDYSDNKWCIFHQDRSNMQLGVAFNVLVASGPVNTGIANANDEEMNFKVFPDPASDNVTISYNLRENSDVSLKLYAADGREIEAVCQGSKAAGNYSLRHNMDALQPGSYYMVLNAGDSRVAYPFVIMR